MMIRIGFLDITTNCGYVVFECSYENKQFKSSFLSSGSITSKKMFTHWHEGFDPSNDNILLNEWVRWDSYAEELEKITEEADLWIMEFSKTSRLPSFVAIKGIMAGFFTAQQVFKTQLMDFIPSAEWQKKFGLARKGKKAVKEYIDKNFPEQAIELKNEHQRDSFLLGIYWIEKNKDCIIKYIEEQGKTYEEEQENDW